jgi:hypothetical protein
MPAFSFSGQDRSAEKVRYALLTKAHHFSYLLIGQASSRQGVNPQVVVSGGVL